MPGQLGRDAIPLRISRHVQVARTGGVVKITIDPSLWRYLLGLGIELFMAVYGLYCYSDQRTV
jgi:hypothetical protein